MTQSWRLVWVVVPNHKAFNLPDTNRAELAIVLSELIRIRLQGTVVQVTTDTNEAVCSLQEYGWYIVFLSQHYDNDARVIARINKGIRCIVQTSRHRGQYLLRQGLEQIPRGVPIFLDSETSIENLNVLRSVLSS